MTRKPNIPAVGSVIRRSGGGDGGGVGGSTVSGSTGWAVTVLAGPALTSFVFDGATVELYSYFKTAPGQKKYI